MSEEGYAYDSIGLTSKGIFWLFAEETKKALCQFEECMKHSEDYSEGEQAKAKCRLILAELKRLSDL